MTDDQDRRVTIDVETATETATRREDVERIRREAGIEAGEPPPRGVTSGEDAQAERDEEEHTPDEPQPG